MDNELINGRYQLEEKLGEGGMATVYLAFDLNLERREKGEEKKVSG